MMVTFLFGQHIAPPDETLKNDTMVRVGRLENGLTYYLRENRRLFGRADTVTISIPGALIVVGDIDVDRMEDEMIIRLLESAQLVAPSMQSVPSDREQKIDITFDPHAQHTFLSVGYHQSPVSSEKMALGKTFLKNMIRQMVADMFNERLEEVAQKPGVPIFSAVGVYNSDMFDVDITSKDGLGMIALEVFLVEVERVKRFGFVETELTRAKERLKRQMEYMVAAQAYRDNSFLASQYVAHFLRNQPYLAPEYEWQVAKGYMPFVGLAQANEVARALFGDDDLKIAFRASQKAGVALPEERDFLMAIASSQRSVLEPYSEKPSSVPLIDPSKIVGGKVIREEKGRFDTKVWVLSNGVRVVIKNTPYRRGEFVVRAYKQGGTSIINSGEVPSTLIGLPPFFSVSGVSAFSATVLNKKIASKIVSLTPTISLYEHGFDGFASSNDFETMLQLLHLRMVSPRFVETEFAQVLAKLHSQLSHSSEFDINKLIYGDQYLRRPSLSQEMIGRVDFATMERVYRTLFTTADGMTVVMVGDVDPNTVQPLVEKYIGSLPVLGVTPAWRDEGVYLPRGEIDTLLSSSAKDPHSTIIHLYHGEMRNSLRNRVMMSILLELLQTFNPLATLESKPAHLFTLMVKFDCDPQQVSEFSELAMALLRNLSIQGPDVERLQEIKNQMMAQRAEDRWTNDYWQSILLHYFCDGVDYDTYFEETIKGINVDAIKDFVTLILSQNNRITIILKPNENEE
ncbi:MAG: insulinase family protein [Prevotellaceae bacterium]|nr:insulinase family protein [Prevotellaceae bacterium]